MRSASSPTAPSAQALPAWRRALPLGLLALLVFPLSGCLDALDGGRGGPPLLMSSGLFTFTAVDRDSTGAEAYPDCAALEEDLEERALDQARVSLDQGVTQEYGYGWGWRGWGFEGDLAVAADSASGPGAPMGATATASQTTGRQSAADAQVTGTNNQESAADEADLVKTDGEWTYVLSGGLLHILHSDRVGDLEEVHTMQVPSGWGGQLLLVARDPARAHDDRLVLVMPGQAPEGEQPLLSEETRQQAMYGGMTRVLVLSLADRSAPEVLEDTWVEGHSTGARLVDGHLYVVVQSYEGDLGLRAWVGPDEEDLRQLGLDYSDYSAMDEDGRLRVREIVALKADLANQRALDETALADHLPVVLRSQDGLLYPQPIDSEDCHSVWSPPQSKGRAVTTVLALDVTGNLGRSTTQVVGGSPIVYADSGSLVLAGPSQDTWWFWAQPELEEATDLLWFDLDGLDVTQRAAGRVPGTVLDSFGIDVRGDELRVATTLGTWGRWWMAEPIPMTSQLVVLEETGGLLLPTGSVGGIAPGERIWSARFTDDRAYLVTFRQTDPLWVIDLVGKPQVLGELEIPGVSTYLHPIGEDALLTVGYGPGPDGLNLDWGSVEVSLFDVSDPKRPERADVLRIAPPSGSSWSSSAATEEHKAFTYWDAIGTLAIPVTTSESYEVRRRGGSEWMTWQHLGLALIDVDTDGMALTLRGEIDQDRFSKPNQWSGGIERSYFLGDPEGDVSVYAISPGGVTAHDLATLQEQAWVAFPQTSYGGYYAID